MTDDQPNPSPLVDVASTDEKVVVNRVSIRTPPFCKDRPALWFASLEAQFYINQIKHEATKFNYAVAHLDTECTKEVEDIITQPPKTNPYTELKNAIISRFSVSYEEKVRRLLEKEQIGDRKPSSFLRHLRSLAGPTFPDQLLKTIWSNRLPRQLQIVLAAQQQQSVSELANLADQLSEINAQQDVYQISGSAPSFPSSEVSSVAALQNQIAELTKTVAALTASGSRNTDRSRDRSANHNRGRGRSRSRNKQYCWYHNRFAAKATKCTHPCDWSSSTDQGKASSGQ